MTVVLRGYVRFCGLGGSSFGWVGSYFSSEGYRGPDSGYRCLYDVLLVKGYQLQTL